MKSFKLIALFCKLGILNEMQYRGNLLLHLFEATMSFTTGMVVMWSVFHQTQTIGGWTWSELLVVLGLWFIVKGIVNAMIAPSIRMFMNDIWMGSLDQLLTKPANHRLLAVSRKFLIFFCIDIVVGAIMLAFALPRIEHSPTASDIGAVVISLVSGAVLIYSFWLILGTLALWATKLENIMLVFYSVFEAGRWPAGLYPGWLRYSMTFLVPIAIAITTPAEALVGRLSGAFLLSAVAAALAAYLFSRWFFDFGLRYKYSGASA
jgi:ABC-2 type transport system permease protein